MSEESTRREVEILRPDGHLTGVRALALKEAGRKVLRAGHDLLVNLSSVQVCDSEGLSSLVAVFRTASDRGRRMGLCAPRYNLRSLLELTRLHRVFDVYPDEEAALASWENGARE